MDEEWYRFDQEAARNTEAILKLARLFLVRTKGNTGLATILLRNHLNERGDNFNTTLANLAISHVLSQQMPQDPS